MKYLLFILTCLNIFSTTALANMKCEIFDLATADIFDRKVISVSVEELKSEAIELDLNHDLVNAKINFQWVAQINKFVLKISASEINNTGADVFALDESQFLKPFKMGHTAIELTGLGDTIHTRCEWFN